MATPCQHHAVFVDGAIGALVLEVMLWLAVCWKMYSLCSSMIMLGYGVSLDIDITICYFKNIRLGQLKQIPRISCYLINYRFVVHFVNKIMLTA